MKIKISLLFLLCICILLAGCNMQTASVTNFYYLTQSDYESPQGNIDHEQHKGKPDPLAYKELLNNYLSGPNSKELINPFPNETHLVSITVEQQTATVVLSDHIAQLTGVDLTLACTCLTLTVRDLTGCANVQIRAQNELLDNHQSISINSNSVQFFDTAK